MIQMIQSIQYDQSSVSSEGNPPTRPILIRNNHPQLPQVLIFHPPQRPLPPDICSLPLLLHLLLPSLLHIEISPSPRPIFGLYNCKSHRAVLGGNSLVLDGASQAPLLLPLLRLISHGEFFCLFCVDETCLKLYTWNIVHPTSTCKHIIVKLLFHHCLLVEGSQSLYIVSLRIRLVLINVECFVLQELFKGLGCLYLHQIEHLFPICLDPNMDIPETHNILLFRIMLCAIVLFFGTAYAITLFVDSFLLCVKCMQ